MHSSPGNAPRLKVERCAGILQGDETQMERRTPVFIVCSPLPHVGKTLLARVLAEYFRDDGRTFAAFDINPDDFALAQQLPDHTSIAHIDDTKGQMALFDQLILADGTTKVVDVGYKCFDQFFNVLKEIDFNSEAYLESIAPVVMFMAEPDDRSAQAYDTLAKRFPELPLVPVLNTGAGTVARARDSFRSKYAIVPLQIPYLAPALKGALARLGLPTPANDRPPVGSSSDLQAWMRRIFLQFRELELRMLLEQLKPALRLRA